MIRAVLSIGANLGDARAALRTVADEFAGETIARSAVFATPPWGGVEQGDFLNAVLIVEVDQSPLELLRRGQALENAAGRVREVHWGPRTLDVDVVQVLSLDDDPAGSGSGTVADTTGSESSGSTIAAAGSAPDAGREASQSNESGDRGRAGVSSPR